MTNAEMVYKEIISKYMLKMEALGEALEGKIAERIAHYTPYPIYDTGEFYRQLTHNVKHAGNYITLRLWSNAKHSKFVLGGKVPSWTPIAPLKAWVQRKRLSWVDKKGAKMTVDQMAYMIQRKIKKYGIKERNVLAEIFKENEGWIRAKLNE